MKIRAISSEPTLDEGIYLSSQEGMGPKELSKARAEKATPSMFMGPEYLYRPDDEPEDIVHLEVLGETEPLPSLVDVDQHQLTGFKGAKIFYAFAVVPSDTWQEPASSRKDFSQIVSDAVNVTNIYSDDTVSDVEESLRKVRRDLMIMFSHGSQQQKDNANKSFEALKKLIQVMQEEGVQTVGELEEITAEGLGAFRDESDYKEKFLFHAAQSLAKKIKRPSTPGEVKMSEEILKRSIQLFVHRFREPFDVIAHPASGSGFNEALVAGLKNHYPNARKELLEKLPGKDTNINWEEIFDRAERGHKDAVRRLAAKEKMPKGYAKLKMPPDRRARLGQPEFAIFIKDFLPLPEVAPDKVLEPTDPEWVEWWAADKVATGLFNLRKSGDNPPDMKALEGMRGDKRYAQIFKGPSQSVDGQRVLVVDDNVAYSATMQILHDLLQQQNPSEIVLFTPFYMSHA